MKAPPSVQAQFEAAVSGRADMIHAMRIHFLDTAVKNGIRVCGQRVYLKNLRIIYDLSVKITHIILHRQSNEVNRFIIAP